MAHLYRLIFLALLCLSSFSALASFPPVDSYDDTYCNPTKYPWPSLPDPKVTGIKWVCGFGGRSPTDCGWSFFSGYTNKTEYNGRCNMGGLAKRCPQGSTMSADGNSCTCNAGLLESFGSCVESRDPESQCGHMAAVWNSTLTPDRTGRAPGRLSSYADGATVCHDSGGGGGLPAGKGCKHKFTGDMSFQDDKGSWWTNGWSIAYDESDKASVGGSLVCNLDDPNPPKESPPPDDCRNGYKGTVNGVDLCVEAWTGDTNGVDWTRVRDADGNESDVKTEVSCHGDQCTVKETKTTKKPDGTVTTTVTTTDEGSVNRQGYCARNPESSICGRKEDDSGASKGQGGKGGGGNNGDGFCKENPDSPICKKGAFGGSCAGGFTCDGDAIQCAIAKEQHVRACKFFDDETAESRAYKAEAAKDKNRDATSDLPGNETVDLASRLSTDNVLGAGACVSDLTVNVHGFEFVVPFSSACPVLGYLGIALVAVASLVAFRIVSGKE